MLRSNFQIYTRACVVISRILVKVNEGLYYLYKKRFFVADFKQEEKKCFLKFHPFLLASNGNFFPLEATIMGIMGVEFEKKHALKRKSVKRLFCYHLEKVFYPHY